jgi:hypothetical protein
MYYFNNNKTMAQWRLEETLNCNVIRNDEVISHDRATVTPKERFAIKLKSGETIENVAVYIPAYVGKPNTQYLEPLQGVLDPVSKKVILDEYMRR